MTKGERKEGWFRILVAIVSGIILSIWKALIVFLSIINWLLVVIFGKRNRELAEFCEYWNSEMYRYLRYLTFVTNKRPFPFGGKVEKISRFI